jgi:hypothetical protein
MKNQTLKMDAGEQIVFIWEHDGETCPFIHYVDPRLVKQYSDYCLVDEDLRSARACFELLRSSMDANHTIQNSLLANAVVTYGRCFTEADARGVILDPNQVYGQANINRVAHDWIMKLRHKFFCHVGGTEYESIMVYLALHPDGKTGPLEVYRGIVRISGFENIQIEQAIGAIDFALDWVKPKIDSAVSRIKDLLKKEEVKGLYKQAIYPDQIEPEVVQVRINRTE